MKYLFLIMTVVFCSSVFSQIEVNKTMSINQIIGKDLNRANKIILTKIDKSKRRFPSGFGNKIIFKDDNTFECRFSAWCGNDCFPSSKGTYKIIDDKHIQLYLISFQQKGTCEEQKIDFDRDLGIYCISKISDQKLQLTKIKQ